MPERSLRGQQAQRGLAATKTERRFPTGFASPHARTRRFALALGKTSPRAKILTRCHRYSRTLFLVGGPCMSFRCAAMAAFLNPNGIVSLSPGLDRRGRGGAVLPWVPRTRAPPTLKELHHRPAQIQKRDDRMGLMQTFQVWKRLLAVPQGRLAP